VRLSLPVGEGEVGAHLRKGQGNASPPLEQVTMYCVGTADSALRFRVLSAWREQVEAFSPAEGLMSH
jgi:hypothetical protein